MIVLLIGSIFHRPIARHGEIARPDHRVTIGARCVFEDVFGEKPAVDLYAKPVSQLDDLNACFRRSPGMFIG